MHKGEMCPYCRSFNTVHLRHDGTFITQYGGAINVHGCSQCGMLFMSKADTQRIYNNLKKLGEKK